MPGSSDQFEVTAPDGTPYVRPEVQKAIQSVPRPGVSMGESDTSARPNLPPGMLVPGNINLTGRPTIKNADGSISSEYSTSFGDDKGREILVPTVVNGRFLTKDGTKPAPGSSEENAMFRRAQEHYEQTGEHMGIFDTPANADTYAENVHNRPVVSSGAPVYVYQGGSQSAKSAAPRSLKNPRLVQAESAYESAMRGREDIRNVENVFKEPGEFAPPTGASYPTLTRTGFAKPLNPEVKPDATLPERQEVLARGIASGMNLAAPSMAIAGAAAPVGGLTALALGTVGSKGAKAFDAARGGTPQEQDLAEQLGWLLMPSTMLGARGGLEFSPEGMRAAGSILGNRAGAGVAVTPEEIALRGRVGPFQGEARIPRNGANGKPALEPQTIEGQQVSTDPASQALAQHEVIQARAARVAQGKPPVEPQPQPAPPKVTHITPEEVAHVASVIQKLPPELRAQGMLEAHQTMARILEQSEKVIGPDGKLLVIDSPKAAEKAAADIVNSEVERQDKLAEKQVAKPESRAAGEGTAQPKAEAAPATPRKTGRQRAQEIAAQAAAKFEVTAPETNQQFEVEHPAEQKVGLPNEEHREVAERQLSTETGKPQSGGTGETGEHKPSVPVDSQGSEAVGPDGLSASVSGGGSERTAIASGNSALSTPEVSKAGFQKGQQVRFSKPFEVRKGPNKEVAETVPQGTTAFIEHAGEGMNFVRLRLPDGRKLSVNQRALEQMPEGEKPFKHRSTQVNIPEGSEAHQALDAARQRIADSDLAGKGKDIGGNHVTVRWGLKAADDDKLEKMKQYLSSLSPFEASLGKTEKFEPSESSEGAAVIQAPIEAKELKQIHDELGKHADFKEPTFSEYKPHATVAYVNPEKADRYVGMSVTHGKKFKVNSIAITDRHGKQEEVQLKGEAKPLSNLTEAKPEEKKPEGGLVIKNMHGETVKRIPTPPFKVEQNNEGHWTVTDKGGTTWQVATDRESSERAAEKLREKYGTGEEEPTRESPEEIAQPSDQTVGKLSQGEGWNVVIKQNRAGNYYEGTLDGKQALVTGSFKTIDAWMKDQNARLMERIRGELAEKEKPAQPLTTEPKIEAGNETPTEGRREVPAAESGRGEQLAPVEPQTGEAPRGERPVGRETRPGGNEGGRNLPAGGGERPSGEPGAGTGESGTVPAEREPAGRRGTRERTSVAPKRNSDWFTHPEEFSVEAGNVKRLQWNLKALTTLKEVLKGEHKLTDEDRDALAHYVGWGALQHAFAPYNSPYNDQQRWIEANRQLRELMTEDEFRDARASTMNAHYTSPQLVRFMWDVAKRLGFEGGTVLEPSIGTGNFFGMMPKAIRSKIQAIGNELDPTTYNIAKLLYPSAKLFNKNYVDLMLPDNSLDFVIGNVPFGEEIYDPHYPKLKARIHDYFIVKSLDKLRPGGVAALITSTGTLDKPNERIRDVMASKADLMFALRFPATTFEKTAGTHVTTDLLIFEKREAGAEPGGEAYGKVVPVEAPHEQDKVPAKDYLNEYFDKHPENLLGKLAISRRLYGSNDLVLLPDKEKPFDESLKAALDRVPKDLIGEFKSTPIFTADAANLAPETLVEGNYFLGPKGQIWQKYQGGTRINPFIVTPKPPEAERITKLIKLRDTLTDLMFSMKTLPNDDVSNAIIKDKQKELLKAYKIYLDKHGLVRSPASFRVFGQDPYYPRLAALEHFDKASKKTTPAEIFTRRTIFPREQLTTLSSNTKDALFQVLSERGKPDIEFMASLSGKEKDELAEELGKQGLVFRDPVGGDYKMADDYLSGYVRDKLADAKAAVAQGQKEYQRNVEALEKVIPADKPLERIAVRPGATWIPIPAIKEFVYRFLGAGYDPAITNIGGSWKVDNVTQSAANISQYGNQEWPATTLLELGLNLRQPTSYDTVYETGEDGKPKERRVVNQQRTIAARELQEKLSDHFSTWMKAHKEWGPTLHRTYNDKYNNLVKPKADGSHMTFPGANLSVLRDGTFMPHQRDVIWQMIQNGRGLIAHVVGAGKTYSMIATGAEMRRLGLSKKILYAVPNHIVEQWARDWQRLYPGANILVIGKDDFSAKARQTAMAKIANNDWDAIIMPHSHFNLMDISAERQMKTFQKDLDELEETLRGLKENAPQGYGRSGRSESQQHKRTVKMLEKAKMNLQAKLKQLADLKSDKAINFDDTGIDTLFVDEAHEYKNLLFYTKMQRVAGLAQGNAKRATRLKMKTDYLLERNGNRGVIFATGTPVQNTMAEMYHMIRYVAPDALEKAGIKYFDDWAANFGKVITAMELSADAESYKPRSKFAEFTNVPELQMMFNSFADVRTNDDLPELKKLLPELEGGKPTIVTVRNPEIEPIVRRLVHRAAAIRGDAVPVLDDAGKQVMEEYTDPKTGKTGMRPKTMMLPKPKPDEDNMLSVVTEGRLAATDPRLLDPTASGKYSKIYDAAKNVLKEYKDGNDKRVTQMVFADRFRYTNPTTKKEEFNLYHELRKVLIEGGIPKDEIAVIHDYDTDEKKLALFDDVNEGKVRVLIGSTQKMGAGTNAQKRLVAEHHVDFPWKPGELEQRNGRIIRQGNMNPKVRIYWYTTEKSFDAYMGQTLEGKAKFIWQVLSGKDVGDTITDAASDAVLSYEEMKAIASGNPDVKRKMELEMKVRKLEILGEQHEAATRQRQGMIETEHNTVARFKAGKKSMEQALANYRAATGEDGKQFALEILGEKFTDHAKAIEWLTKEPTPLSNLHMMLNGLPVIIEPKLKGAEDTKASESQIKYVEYRMPYPTLWRNSRNEVQGLTSGTYTAPAPALVSAVRSAESTLRNLPYLIKDVDEAITFRQKRVAELEKLAGEEKHADTSDLQAARKELREVNQRLGIDEFQAALEQEVASDVDSSADQGEEEGEEPQTIPGESLGERLKGESGSFEPGKIADAAKTVKDFLNHELEDNRRARELQWQMYDLDKMHTGRVLQARHLLEQLQEKGVTQDDRRAIDDHLDALEADSDSVPVPPLTPFQDEILDRVLLPIKEEAESAFKKVTDGGLTIPNYNPRQTKGKGGYLDRVMSKYGQKWTGRANLLSQNMPATKHRVMMAIENEAGDRHVVSIKKGKATMWQDGQPTELGEVRNAKGKGKVENETFPEGEPNSYFYDKGMVVEGPDGYDWKIVGATKNEIEKNSGVEYYHDAAASAIVNWLQAKKAEAAYDLVEGLKKDPDFKNIAMQTGKGNPPNGWRTTNLPQFKGYYFEPHTAEVLDWFFDRLKSGDSEAFQNINRYMRVKILLNPIKHPLNITAQWALEKGVTGFLPNKWVTIAKTGSRAISAVVNQNDDLVAAYKAGFPGQAAHEATRDLVKLFYEQMADAADKGEPWSTKAARALAFPPKALVEALHGLASKIAWPVSDILFLQSAYQYQAEHSGVSLNDAFREVGKIIPEYRLPVRIMNSKTLGKLMSSPVATLFGSYHYGLLRSFAESAKDAMGGEPGAGQSKTESTGKGWDRLMLLAAGAFLLYAALDKMAQEITGDKDATVRRHGIFGLIDAAMRVARKEEKPTQAMTRVLTANPATEGIAQLFFNRDFQTGHMIYDPAAKWAAEREQLLHYLLVQGEPMGSEIERARQTDKGWQKFAWNQGDVNFPKHGAAALAQQIASTKYGSAPMTDQERQKYAARQKAIEGLRRGDDTAIEEARGKGLFNATEARELHKRARKSDIEDKVREFTVDELREVHDRAVADGDQDTAEKLARMLRQKRRERLARHLERFDTEAETAVQ